jgi:hypothetical protein
MAPWNRPPLTLSNENASTEGEAFSFPVIEAKGFICSWRAALKPCHGGLIYESPQ